MVVDGKHRHCSAVPPEELLAHLERRFQASKKRAAKSLAERAGPPEDQRVYQLGSPSAVFERARAMISKARQILILDAFPGIAELLAPEIAAAAGRGVRVGAQLYDRAPEALQGIEQVDVIFDPRGRTTLDRWPGQWLVLVTDAREMLLAFFDAEVRGVHQAVWSRSPYLVWAWHSASASELVLSAVESAIEDGADLTRIRSLLADLLPLRAHQADAYFDLRRSLDSSDSSASSATSPPLAEPNS